MKLPKNLTLEIIQQAVEADDNSGFCTACGAHAYGVEPDAEEYPCEECGQDKVYGAEELLVRLVP